MLLAQWRVDALCLEEKQRTKVDVEHVAEPDGNCERDGLVHWSVCVAALAVVVLELSLAEP